MDADCLDEQPETGYETAIMHLIIGITYQRILYDLVFVCDATFLI